MNPIIKKRTLGKLPRSIITVSHHISYQLAKRVRTQFPIVFVTGYPKSGTVWACQMVADYLQLPFADLSYFPIGFPSVMHGHQLIEKGGPPAVYVMRDGRDCMVSMYFHMMRDLPEGANPQKDRRYRRYFPGITDMSNINANLPRFIEAQLKRPNGTPHHWGKHVQSYYSAKRANVPIMKFEDLKMNTGSTLAYAVQILTGEEADMDQVDSTVSKFSFARQSGRKPGQEDRSSFLRKGVVGDWVNYFNREAAEIFDDNCGDMLLETGYANDKKWIDQCSDLADKAPNLAK